MSSDGGRGTGLRTGRCGFPCAQAGHNPLSSDKSTASLDRGGTPDEHSSYRLTGGRDAWPVGIPLEEASEPPAGECAGPRRVFSSAPDLSRTSWSVGAASQGVPRGKGVFRRIKRFDPDILGTLFQCFGCRSVGDRNIKRNPFPEDDLFEKDADRVR